MISAIGWRAYFERARDGGGGIGGRTRRRGGVGAGGCFGGSGGSRVGGGGKLGWRCVAGGLRCGMWKSGTIGVEGIESGIIAMSMACL